VESQESKCLDLCLFIYMLIRVGSSLSFMEKIVSSSVQLYIFWPSPLPTMHSRPTLLLRTKSTISSSQMNQIVSASDGRSPRKKDRYSAMLKTLLAEYAYPKRSPSSIRSTGIILDVFDGVASGVTFQGMYNEAN